jgi:electron transfer flavoprotein alpha subunit
MNTIDKSAYRHILVYAQQREDTVEPVALELLGKARELATALNEQVIALLVGHRIGEQSRLLVEHGADQVICVDAPELEHYLTEPYSQAVYQVITAVKPSIVLIGASTVGRDLAPRLSARLQTGLTADCTRLEIGQDKNLLMTRPAFGGNLMATITCTEHRPQMSTVRPGVMQKICRDSSREGETVIFKPQFDPSQCKVKFIRSLKRSQHKINIADAKILISGGRGVGNQEGFEKLNRLATILGGQVAASRAAVDAGVIPHERQVGQTGKTVRPDLYIACGISGAIQHLAGMEESEYIIAVNKDKFAPIFQRADLGIVGDVHQIIPLLKERLEKEIKQQG